MRLPDLKAPEPIAERHGFSDFDSGQPLLDEWLKRRAIKNHASGASRCFVLCRDTEVIGYYCLSAGAISHQASPKAMRRNMPDPLPVLVLGRLAIDKRYQNLGIGRALLRDAMIRSINVARDAGVFAILVHANSNQARQFYLSRSQPITAAAHDTFDDDRNHTFGAVRA